MPRHNKHSSRDVFSDNFSGEGFEEVFSKKERKKAAKPLKKPVIVTRRKSRSLGTLKRILRLLGG